MPNINALSEDMSQVKVFVTDRRTDRRTDRGTDGQMRFNVPTLLRQAGDNYVHAALSFFSVYIYRYFKNSTKQLFLKVNCLISKGPTSHLLADFYIMTSQSNGPSNSCAIVTSQ